jgi:hypothetical protein
MVVNGRFKDAGVAAGGQSSTRDLGPFDSALAFSPACQRAVEARGSVAVAEPGEPGREFNDASGGVDVAHDLPGVDDVGEPRERRLEVVGVGDQPELIPARCLLDDS